MRNQEHIQEFWKLWGAIDDADGAARPDLKRGAAHTFAKLLSDNMGEQWELAADGPSADCWLWDHVYWYKRSGCRRKPTWDSRVAVCHPYASRALLDELLPNGFGFCPSDNDDEVCAIHLGSPFSWWYPDRTTSVLFISPRNARRLDRRTFGAPGFFPRRSE